MPMWAGLLSATAPPLSSSPAGPPLPGRAFGGAMEVRTTGPAPAPHRARETAVETVLGDRVAAEVVPGDVLALAEGDIVPAAARILEAAALLLDESMLTGESLPVAKQPAGAGHDGGAPAGGELWAGTVVLRGRALAAVTATGADSALGRIAALLRPRPEPREPLPPARRPRLRRAHGGGPLPALPA
ncbi:hypothetical protein ABZW10_21765 [Kitasatospora sp. NPDC004723]|uniref:P-type ATPase n=1 Tax=Kitasatospora sp. NPDC004723 TaxID=3154288 RepID=UPI0033A39152